MTLSYPYGSDGNVGYNSEENIIGVMHLKIFLIYYKHFKLLEYVYAF